MKKIFYISKYQSPSTYGTPSRGFFLSKYINNYTNEVNFIYSRSNGQHYDFSIKIYNKQRVENLNCVRINGILLKQMGFSFKRIFSWLQFEINLFTYLLFLPKAERPDTIIVSSLSLLTFFTVSLYKKLHNFQMIVEVRDIWPQTLIDSGKFKKGDFVIKILKKIELTGYQHADKILSTLPKFDNYLSKQNINNKPFICIPQGYDPEDRRFDSSIIYKKPKNNSFQVVYAGSIGNLDYVNELCECAELLNGEDIIFTIFGKGEHLPYLIKKFNYLPNLKFAGYKPKNTILDYLKEADLLVNMWGAKSIYEYGVSPNKWVDYMMAGKPILVSYNGYKSIINEANCGWFIEPHNPRLLADTILSISKKDKEYLAEIGNNGREYLINYLNYQSLADKLLHFINI